MVSLSLLRSATATAIVWTVKMSSAAVLIPEELEEGKLGMALRSMACR